MKFSPCIIVTTTITVIIQVSGVFLKIVIVNWFLEFIGRLLLEGC